LPSWSLSSICFLPSIFICDNFVPVINGISSFLLLSINASRPSDNSLSLLPMNLLCFHRSVISTHITIFFMWEAELTLLTLTSHLYHPYSSNSAIFSLRFWSSVLVSITLNFPKALIHSLHICAALLFYSA
jgi:hypothetical protein